MDSKERYEREAQAKGGSMPPDKRRNSKARATARDPHKREQSKHDSESAGFATVEIEHITDDQRKAIMQRDVST